MDTFKQVYPHSFEMAKSQNEIPLYRESIRCNITCARAIETAIRNDFDGMHLNRNTAQNVIKNHGQERVNTVLANTLCHSDFDGRFSREHKKWAKAYILPNIPPDHTYDFIVGSHPAVLDGFLEQALIYERCTHVVEYLIQEGTHGSSSHHWIADFGDIPPYIMEPWRVKKHQDLIADLIAGREEVADIQIVDNTFDIVYYTEYCSNYEPPFNIDIDNDTKKIAKTGADKSSILARLEGEKRQVVMEQNMPKSAPKHSNEREV